MRYQGYTRAILFVLSIAAARAQNPGQPKDPPAQTVLTPEQQREKEIRMFDPLDKTDPTATGTNSVDAPSPSLPDVNQQPSRSNQPLPGSAAAPNQLAPVNPRTQGPRVVSGDSDEPVQEYTGPAVLSRSYTISRPMVPRQVRWSPSIGISESLDTGLTGGALKPDGTLANLRSFGTTVNWGFAGRHFWKHDQVGVSYGGNYNRYSSQNSYNGTNEFLNVDLGHEFSRRLSLNLVETGSITSQSYALLDTNAIEGGSIANMSLAASPSTQILDQGTKQFNSMADLTWRKSNRLSFNFGGGYFAVVRAGSLFGNTGYQARADVNYRYTRRITVGLYYSFSDYVYTQHVDVSNAHTFGGIFSYALNRATQFRLRAGATRVENLGLTTVQIDPAIAILIGRGIAIVDEYRLSLLSDISAEAVRDFGRNRSLNFSYARGVAPGNGLLLTSSQESEAAAFTMLLLRRYQTTASLGRTTLSSVSQTMGSYATDFVSFAVTRSLPHGVASNFSIDYRRFQLSNEPTLHSQLRLTAGVSWTRNEAGR